MTVARRTQDSEDVVIEGIIPATWAQYCTTPNVKSHVSSGNLTLVLGPYGVALGRALTTLQKEDALAPTTSWRESDPHSTSPLARWTWHVATQRGHVISNSVEFFRTDLTTEEDKNLFAYLDYSECSYLSETMKLLTEFSMKSSFAKEEFGLYQFLLNEMMFVWTSQDVSMAHYMNLLDSLKGWD